LLATLRLPQCYGSWYFFRLDLDLFEFAVLRPLASRMLAAPVVANALFP